MSTLSQRLICSVLFLLYVVTLAKGHGRLVDPPSRSTMWREGFNTTHNYNDNQLNCGGAGNQWDSQGGKCGLCGDPFQQTQPRDNEGGGKYGQGVISRRYTKGQVITTTVQITANHIGYFVFSICKQNNPKQTESEACFDANILKIAGTNNIKWHLFQEPVPKKYSVQLQLPADLECWQCVFRWKWRAGNNWGTDKDGQGKGFGPQEHFFGCSDISIGEIPKHTTTPETYTSTPPATTSPKSITDLITKFVTLQPVTTTPPGPPRLLCRPIGIYMMVHGLWNWCDRTCNDDMLGCPQSHCCCLPNCPDLK